MDALDDLLNDLNAVTRELGFDTSPSEPASSTSVTSEKSSVSAESGLGLSNDLSNDFQTIKKVTPPKPPKLQQKPPDSSYSEGTYNDGLDQIMNSLNSLGSDLNPEKAKEPEKQTPPRKKSSEMINRLVTTPPKVQTAKRVSFRSSAEIEENEFNSSPSKALEVGKLPKPGLPPQILRSAGASPQKPPVRPRLQQVLPPPPNTPKASVSSTGSSDSLKMPPPPPKFPPPALTPPVTARPSEKVMFDGPSDHQRIPPFAETPTILRNRQYIPPEKKAEINQHQVQVPSQPTAQKPTTQPMNPEVNNFMEKIKVAEHVRIFSGEGSYKLIPVEKGMSVRYITQLMAEKHRVRLTAKHSLLEYNPELATERILEEHENVCEVIQNWEQTPCEIHFLERKDKWLLFSNPQVILERKQAQGQPSREERHKILQRWFPDRGGFNYPGYDGQSVVRDTVYYKNDAKDKWNKKYIELRGHKLLIFKKESAREKAPEEIVDLQAMLLFRGVEWKSKFKAPLANGFAVRHPKVTKMNKSNNPNERIRFFAVEDQLDELKWITALRLAKLGLKMIENYRNTISTVERPSSLLSLRPPSFGPLPVSNSRPNSLETLQVDGLQSSPKKPAPPSMPPTGQVHQAIMHPPPAQNIPQAPKPQQPQLTLHRPPPMTNFYNDSNSNQAPASPLRRGDFPPPPPFISQIKQLSSQVHEQGDQSNRSIGFDLPPPPPELMVQAARSSKMNGSATLPTPPRGARPPPPRRNPNTRLHH